MLKEYNQQFGEGEDAKAPISETRATGKGLDWSQVFSREETLQQKQIREAIEKELSLDERSNLSVDDPQGSVNEAKKDQSPPSFARKDFMDPDAGTGELHKLSALLEEKLG